MLIKRTTTAAGLLSGPSAPLSLLPSSPIRLLEHACARLVERCDTARLYTYANECAPSSLEHVVFLVLLHRLTRRALTSGTVGGTTVHHLDLQGT